MKDHKTKTYVRRAMKIVLWIFAGIAGLIILAVTALQFHGVQRYIAQQAVSLISEKTHTRIEIGSVNIAFTNSVVLKNIFVESRQGDTLLSIQSLAVDVNLLGLFSHEINLTNIRVDSLTAHITRTLPDSSFNFDFILKAFSSDSATDGRNPDTTSGSDWDIQLGGLSFNGIYGTYVDEVSGLNLLFRLGMLRASVDKFDLDKMQFHVGKLSLENTTAGVVQTKESLPDGSKSKEVDIGVGSISLANIHFTYENAAAGERYGIDLGTSTLVAEKIDLPSHRIALKKFQLENTDIVIVQPKREENATEESDPSAFPWVITLDQLILSGNSLHYDVQGTAAAQDLDFNHLRFDGIAIQAENLHYSESRIAAEIGHTAFREHSGVEVRALSGGFILDSLHAQLTGFIVETAASRIQQDIQLSYASLSELKNFPGNASVTATFGDSHIAIPELLFFFPSLPIKNNPGAAIRFSSRLSGLVGELNVEELRVAAGDSTTVNLTGSIRGLPDAETAYYDVHLRQFISGRNDIQALAADTLLPKAIVFPASINVSGNFKGTLKNFSASTDVATSIGSVKGNVELNSGMESKNSRWKTDVSVEEFDVGSLLNDTLMFGAVSLKASAAGTGLTKDDVKAKLKIEVDKAVVNGYPYRRLSINGTAGAKMFEGRAEIQDSNLAFAFNGTINMSKENPVNKFTFDLKGADLRRLNFTSDDIRVSGIITSDFVGEDINDINGNVDIRHVVIVKNNKRYVIDSLVYVSVIIEEQTHISIASTIFTGQFDGTIVPGQLPEVLKEHFEHYFTLQGTQRKKELKAQAFSFHISVLDPSTLTDIFIPELHRLSAGIIEGSFDSDKKNLNANIDLPGIDYNDVTVDSLTVSVTSDSDIMQATLRIGSISDSTFHITNFQIAGKAGHDSITGALQSTGNDGFTKILLAGIFSTLPDGYKFQFTKDGIVFQNIPWTVPSDNELLFGKGRFIAHNILLQGGGQSLFFNSADEMTLRPPLRIEFKDFELATLAQIAEREGGLLGGTLDGNVVLLNLEKQMAFTSDLNINGFKFSQRLVGDIALQANNQTENVYEVNMDITGNGNQISVLGNYRSQMGGSELDLKFDFAKLNLAGIEPFTFGSVRRLSGTMTGGLHVTGTMKKPSIFGELNFSNAAFTPAFLDSYLRLNNGKIAIDAQGVQFSSFDLVDTLGSIASLRGRLYTEDFRTYSYDFRVHTDNFLLLNKPASPDALYYGTVFLDSDISVKGDGKRQTVTVRAELDKGTNLAIVLPKSELAVEERRGIVRFVDRKIPASVIMSRWNRRTNRDTTEEKISTMELTSNISVTKDSKLRILIDPTAGDSLVIRGEATLSFTIDQSGKITLTGRYEILEGSYQLSFGDFIKREFAIAKGSSLSWFGSPYEAEVDITAIYTVRTTVLDLIQDQLTGISQEERNKYKQEIPIQVYLMMKGKLLTPEIHFRLDLPPDKRGVLSGTVYAKLNELNGQESELNKQVFALLVLGRFISESPLASVGGNEGLTDFARSSASQILSAQLNRLSQRYITGVDLNVGLDSYQDYSTGNAEGRTQLQLALSKELFNERVTVQVGGNVDIEGHRSRENSLNNFAGDLKVLYKLTEDGRWQLQVFRQNTYEGAIDGDITKTGAGVVFTIDFDKLFGITLKPVAD